MATKEKVKRMDWYKWFPRDVLTSIAYKKLTLEQQGAYRNILDHLWMEFPTVDAPVDDETVLRLMSLAPDLRTWNRIKPAVLSMFTVENGRLFHPKMVEQRDETVDIIELSVANAKKQGRIEPEPQLNRSSPYGSTVAPPIDNNREDKTIIDNSKTTLGDLLSEHADRDVELGALAKGTPGYFERGQYPGTAPKKIFEHIQGAWRRVRGAAAVARYPSKYPESWEELCTSGGDLLVPAFELWATEEGRYITNQYPTAQFVKDAQRYMERIIPLNALGPKKKVVTGKEPELQAAFAAQDKKLSEFHGVRSKEERDADKQQSAELRDVI